MSLKKYLIPALVVLVLMTSVTTAPVYAQDNTERQGFFKELRSFFSSFLGNEKSQSDNQQKQQQQPEMQKGNDQMRPQEKNEASRGGMPRPASPSGQMIPGEEGRLKALVAQGKITEAQKTAILKKLKSLQEELKAWATREGIDPQYVMMPGNGPQPMMIKEGSAAGKMRPQGEMKRPQGQESNQKMMRPNNEPQKMMAPENNMQY